MRIIIYPAKPVWNTAKRLANGLREVGHKVLLVGRNNTKYKAKDTDLVINWGNSKYPSWPIYWLYNDPVDNLQAINKIYTFEKLKEYGIPHPEWTTDYDVAADWWEKGKDIVGRLTATGYGGDDIVIYTKNDDQFDSEHLCKLYVKYKKKKHEYRVHVFNDEVIDVTWKRKKKGAEIDTKIRNFKNGWVYCREGIKITENLLSTARDAISVLNLHFGAVDLIWNEKEDKYYVLEVNTAPGLVETSLNNYVKYIHEAIN